MSILLPTNMVNGLDTDLARLTPLETDVAALKPGALQTFSGDLVYDFSSLIQTDICDFTINIYSLSGTVNDASVYMQLSSDAGTSWISSAYYAASPYTSSGDVNTHTYAQANTSSILVSFSADAGPANGPSGYLRIMRVGTTTDIEGVLRGTASDGSLQLWMANSRLRGHDANALRFYWSSGTTDGGSYSIQDNLRPA